MILVDLSQIMISNVMARHNRKGAEPLTEDSVRHSTINSLRLYRNKFYKKYGELVICRDSKDVWRKEMFPYYKIHRKTQRDATGLDWMQIFSILNIVSQELIDNFPYKVIEHERAEADDIIGALCEHLGVSGGLIPGGTERILILSGDKDFGQLQKFDNVEQFAPVQKKFITVDNVDKFIFEHVVKGDRGDGVPNILSPDNTFVDDTMRQTPLTQKKIDHLRETPMEDWDLKHIKGYKRNQQLIDLDYVPEDIKKSIINKYENTKPALRSKLFNYFIKYKLKYLMENIQEF